MKVAGKISAAWPSAAPGGHVQRAGAEPATRASLCRKPRCNTLAEFQSRGFQTQIPKSLETERG